MSSQKNISPTFVVRDSNMGKSKVIASMFITIDAGKFDNLVDYVDLQVVYERPGYQAYSGVVELLDFYKNVRDIKEGIHHIEHIVSSDETAMCCGHFKGRSKNGGMIDIGFSEMYGFQNDKIKFRRTYFFQPAV